MSDNTTPASTLTLEQQQRAEALYSARRVLVNRAGAFGGSGAADPIDLVNLAQYIITGDDPWEASITRAVDSAAETAATALGDAIGGTTRKDDQ